jgi:two-component system, NarL family, sensor histidine kinase UhpB
MSLRASLNILITALLLLVLALGTSQLLRNARAQVQAEVESVSAMVERMADPVNLFFVRPHRATWPEGLRSLSHLRHIRIEMYDAQGSLIHSNANAGNSVHESEPPQWFNNLMTRNLVPIRMERTISSDGQLLGKVVIKADPSYEVEEVWEDFVGLFWLVSFFFIAVNLLVYWAVSRAVKPVGNILQALNALERGNLQARLPTFKSKELSSISEKFNGMAQTLEISITRNHRLTQQLIYLQEEERKHLARDLHDELGQCLTAILADATALLRLSETRLPEAKASAQAVLEVTHDVMDLLRAMLQRLRPDVLDELGLLPALEELVANWRERNVGESCISKFSNDLNGLPDELRITPYRVVQECLTNISRHAHARRVRVEVIRVWGSEGDSELRIEVEDDGRGFDVATADGFGLSGMRERVEGLGGVFRVQSGVGQGTRVTAILPVKEEVSA